MWFIFNMKTLDVISPRLTVYVGMELTEDIWCTFIESIARDDKEDKDVSSLYTFVREIAFISLVNK